MMKITKEWVDANMPTFQDAIFDGLLHGLITDGESDKIKKRLRKKLEALGYNVVTVPSATNLGK